MRDRDRSIHPATNILAYDLETVSTIEPADGAFPPWPTHRVVAAGFAKAELVDGAWRFELDAVIADTGSGGEAALIREADERLRTCAVATTYNGRGFDAVVLRAAAVRERLFGLGALATHAGAHRYAHEHADLADLFSSHGAARRVSLAEICREVGIPVKTSTTGADVAELWRQNQTARIRDYVLEDAVATLCLWFCWAAFQAADEALVTRPLAALARHIEATPDLVHLQAFVDCDLMGWARPRALRADVGAALGRVQDRLKREEVERSFLPSA